MKTRRYAGMVILVLAGVGVPAVRGQDAVDQLEKSLDVPIVAPETAPQAAAGHGYLGMSVDLVAPEGNAVFVTAVVEGGPAQRGGLQADDVIVAINDTPIKSIEDMDRTVRKPAGTKLAFQVRRAGAVQKLEVTLGTPLAEAAPSAPVAELPEPAPAPAANPPATRGVRPSLGISVDDVEDLTRRRFAVTVNAGAVITQIRQGSPAARAGLPLGGVIVSVNGKRISSADDLVQFIQAFRPGDLIEITYFEGDRIGRKRLSLAPAGPAVAPQPSTPKSRTTDPSDPPLRLGRRRPGSRPVLDALERAVDGTMLPQGGAGDGAGAAEMAPPPPVPDAAAGADHGVAVEPPPPPAFNDADATPGQPKAALQPELPPLPADDSPKSVLEPGPPGAATDPAQDLAELRRQRESLRKQLQEIQRRIEKLERRR